MAKRERRRATDAGRRRPASRGWLDRQSLLVTLAICLGLLVAVAIVFAQALRFDFVNFDDKAYLYQNDYVRKGLSWQGFAWAFGSFYQFNWHPLTWLSHMADYQAYPVWPGGHHLTSVLLHAATVLLLFTVLLRMTGERWPSAGVAALFAIHPLHVESVAWVAERKDVLSGFFFVLTIAAYASYVRRQSRIRYALVVLCLALGLLAKPMLVTLPFVLLLLDYWPLRRFGNDSPAPSAAEIVPYTVSFRQAVVEKVPFLILAAASCIVTWLAQRGAIKPLDHFPFMDRVANAISSYGGYLLQSIWPTGLAAQYPYDSNQPIWKVATSLGLIAAISVAAIVWRRRFPYLLVGWLWFLGMLVPVIGLVQVGDQSRADRYMYLPLIGPALALAWGIADFARTSARRRLCGAASAVALAALTVAAWRQADFWHDSEALWTRALSCTSGNWMALNNLGTLCMNTNRTDQAVVYFEAALEVRPNLALRKATLASRVPLKTTSTRPLPTFKRRLISSPTTPRPNWSLPWHWRKPVSLGRQSHITKKLSAFAPTTPRPTVIMP